MSKDLIETFPNVSGFSESNLKIIRIWYKFYTEKSLQVVNQFNLEEMKKLFTSIPCVIELKTEKFEPSFAGQLKFYVTAVNKQIKAENDNPTIGILICKSKDEVVAEYALEGIEQPIGITEYQITKVLTQEIKSSLPSIEEIELEVKNFEN